jgi:hypothetical protein
MFSCCIAFKPDALTCVHKCKNARYVHQGWKPRSACFVPFASAHAQRHKVMRINALGLLHCLHMETLPANVHIMLPVLQWYALKMHACNRLPITLLVSCQPLKCSWSTLRSLCVASHGVISTWSMLRCWKVSGSPRVWAIRWPLHPHACHLSGCTSCADLMRPYGPKPARWNYMTYLYIFSCLLLSH